MDEKTITPIGTGPPESTTSPPAETSEPAATEPKTTEPETTEEATEPEANPPEAKKKVVDWQARKFQLTFNNPIEHGFPHAEIKLLLAQLKSLKYYCLADEIGLEGGTHHTHLFLLFKNSVRSSRIKNLFPGVHLEKARTPATVNRDYIMKSGQWAETDKAKTSLPGTFEEWGDYTELGQGYRSDLEAIQSMLDEGFKPSQIFASDLMYRRYEKMVRGAYFDKRNRETPVRRKVKVHYLVGESGSGKTNTLVQLCDEFGEDEVYALDDYGSGGFDMYQGERILFMDELKEQLKFADLLTLLDVYKKQRHARYTNILMLWEEVYISTIYPPEELYALLVEEKLRERDTIEQLYRRITDITYHYIDEDGKFRKHTIPMREYLGYQQLQQAALEHATDNAGFVEVDLGEQIELPFTD